MIRAFSVTLEHIKAIVFAETASKARYRCYLSAVDANYQVKIIDFRVIRAPEFDNMQMMDGSVAKQGWCYGPTYLQPHIEL